MHCSFSVDELLNIHDMLMCKQMVPTVLEYAGQKVRGGGSDLFDSDAPAPIAITKKFFKGLKVPQLMSVITSVPPF